MASMQKHIERRIRRAFIGTLGLLRGREADTGAIARMAAPRILLIRHDRIGDAIVSTPVMTLLRERFPDARIDILLSAKNGAVAPILPAIDERILLGGSRESMLAAIRCVRRNRYDIAINLLVKDSASGALLTGLSGARFRIGFTGATANVYDIAVEHPATPMHIVRETSLLLAPLGIDAIGERPRSDAQRLSVAIPEEARSAARELLPELSGSDGEPTVVLNISGSGPEKFWGVEQFTSCARSVRRG
jgi:ADP-heptose:LPS heptosyltransferase